MPSLRSICRSALAAVLLGASLTQAAPSPSSGGDITLPPILDPRTIGINLGGWFVLEPWITPSMFEQWAESQEVVDEFTFTKVLGEKEAFRRLSRHWDTWITKRDFHEIAERGLGFVRIPIGHWAFMKIPGEPYVQGAKAHLAKALDWAYEAGLSVVIDLHGAPRSQNGYDNSGRRGNAKWLTGNSVKQTLQALQKIQTLFGHHPAVSAIQILNEPAGYELPMKPIKKFYKDAYKIVRKSDITVGFHDAFKGPKYWNNFGTNQEGWLLDTHHYEIFDVGQLQMNVSQHIKSVCKFGKEMANAKHKVISGEWTGAMTDCAKWLNGLGRGARWDGTFENDKPIGTCKHLYQGKVAALPAETKANIRKYIEAQMDAYESAGGWIWWTWKTEGAPEWDFQDLAKNGVMPQPLTDRKYPNQCKY